jgi:tripartite-type tricarboxylate transporter receptor subunit TctC
MHRHHHCAGKTPRTPQPGRRRAAAALACAILASVAALGTPTAQAAESAASFPSKPIRIIPYGPGGSPVDLLARLYGEELRKQWGQNVIVDAKPGASGILAADAVAKAAPDGYTIMITLQTTHINNVLLHTKLPYDPVKDFTPLSQLAIGPGPVLVAAVQAPYSNVKDLLAYAKTHPSLSYGTWGIGSSAHLFGELLRRTALPGLIHVPYKTEATAHQDMQAGRLDLAWANPGTARTMAQAGQMKVLASPGAKRSLILPDVPTFAEQGLKGFELESWIGAYAPADLPKPIRDKLVEGLRKATTAPDVKARIIDLGFRPFANTPEEFVVNSRSDFQRVKELVTAAGVTPEN